MIENLYILMPVKNEADRYLSVVLQHCLSFSPHVFVYDDQSTDDTVKIADELGAVVSVRPDHIPSFTEHEGAFRQGSWKAFESVMQPKVGDWVFSIDADEILYGIEFLGSLLNQTQFDVLGVMFYHFWNKTQYRIDKAWRPSLGSRLYRYYEGGEYKQNKLASGAEPTYVIELIRQGRAFWQTPLKMAHLSYIEDYAKLLKYNRYKEIDGGSFHSLNHINSIIDTNIELVNWEGQALPL